MTGYWPSSFLRAYGPRQTETESRSMNCKKRTRPIFSHLDRTSLVIKGFIICLLGNFSCETRRVVPGGQDSPIFNARVANHSAPFGSSCSLTELDLQQGFNCIFYVYVHLCLGLSFVCRSSRRIIIMQVKGSSLKT